MSYVWCHGPLCHTYSTQDRVRGSKGSKVLRTRKVKQHRGYQLGTSFYNWFCSQSCERDFCNKYTQQIIAIAPRTEALETPIDVVVETRTDYFGHPYTTKQIKNIDSGEQLG